MTNDIDSTVVSNIRALYRKDENAKKIFDLLANRTRDVRITTVDWVMRKLELWRGDAVDLLKALDEAGCGTIYYGRRGAKTRIEWDFSCISIGQAAAGEASKLESVEDAMSEDDDFPAAIANNEPLTIAKAKILLAESLGVNPLNIEITVRG